MPDIKLKEDYSLSGCCSPVPEDRITGYYNHDNHIKVHRSDCSNLAKADRSRLVTLEWEEIVAADPFQPESDYGQLDATDFAILAHHRDYGIDYSLMLAKMLTISKQDAFDRHTKLRKLKLVERVDAVMVRYRKKIVDNKWIKHRNHTYYNLTDKGRSYLAYHGSESAE